MVTAAGVARLTSPPAFPSPPLSPRCGSGGSPQCVPRRGPPQRRSDTDTESTQALSSILSLQERAETKQVNAITLLLLYLMIYRLQNAALRLL